MAKRTSDTVTEPLSVIYAGPTLHRRVIVGGSVYKGGIPAHVQELAEKVPEVRALLVSVKEYPETRRATQTQGTEAHRLYNYLSSVRFDGNGEVRK